MEFFKQKLANHVIREGFLGKPFGIPSSPLQCLFTVNIGRWNPIKLEYRHTQNPLCINQMRSQPKDMLQKIKKKKQPKDKKIKNKGRKRKRKIKIKT
jgi:hypothetical protein